METTETILNRYSCRKFKQERIREEELNKILEAGRMAPSACNLQPVIFYVCQSEDVLNQFKTATRYTFDAKTILVIGYDETKAWVRGNDKKNHGDVDATIAATTMMLEAYSLGIGSTYVCSFREDVLKEILGVPESVRLSAMLPLGYPDEVKKPNSRKPLEEYVIYK